MDDYATTFEVNQSPEEVFTAINDVPGWWSGQTVGETDRLGAEFTYTVPDVHFCRLRISELIPGQRVAWRVIDSDLPYTKARNEWTDTEIRFELSKTGHGTEVHFTHSGLVPAHECYGACSNAWNMLVNGNLRKRIVTGAPQPNVFANGAPTTLPTPQLTFEPPDASA